MGKELLRSWTKDDFIVDWFSGTGAGGQHRNKHQNCLRLTDKETGITVTAQNFRERKQNMKQALNEMAVRLVNHHYPKEERERFPTTVCRRTWNIPDNRVVDHLSGNKSTIDSFDIDLEISIAPGYSNG